MTKVGIFSNSVSLFHENAFEVKRNNFQKTSSIHIVLNCDIKIRSIKAAMFILIDLSEIINRKQKSIHKIE